MSVLWEQNLSIPTYETSAVVNGTMRGISVGSCREIACDNCHPSIQPRSLVFLGSGILAKISSKSLLTTTVVLPQPLFSGLGLSYGLASQYCYLLEATYCHLYQDKQTTKIPSWHNMPWQNHQVLSLLLLTI